MSIVKHEEQEEQWKVKTRIQQHMSICILASFTVLLLSAVTFIIAVGTVNWYSNDENLSIGVWQYCVLEQEANWTCYICVADFIMAVQTFVILCLLGYACAVFFCVCSFVFKTQRSTRLIAIGLCVLNFCIVSLQIMTIICYAVKVDQYSRTLQKEYFPMRTDMFKMSWSFGMGVLTAILTTISGVFSIIEIRNIAMQVFEAV